MPTLTSLSIGQTGALSSGARAMLNMAQARQADPAGISVLVPGAPAGTRPSTDAGWAEAHCFSDDGYTDFPALANIVGYWRQLPLSIPMRSENRRLYFGLWFDGFTSAEAAGSVQFLREGNTVLSIPFNVSRTGNSIADSHGLSLAPMDVWRLDPADEYVVPSSGAIAPDALTLADTGTAYRYVTTLAPIRLRVTADQVRVDFWKWLLSADTGAAAFVHVGVISDQQ